MYQISNNGKEITLNIFRPGSYFPMIWAITSIINIYYCEAMTPTTIYKAPKEDTLQLLKNNPELLLELTSRMVVGFYNLISNMELLLSANASQRVSMILIILANRFGHENGNKTAISLTFSHEDIAKLVSLTRETTSLEMKKLKELNIINYSRSKIVINDFERLQAQSGYQQTKFISS